MGRPRLAVQGQDGFVIVARHRNVGNIFGKSKGGPAEHGEVLNRPHRQDFNQLNRYDPKSNDTLIAHERGLMFRRPEYIPAANPWVNWTAAGPAKDLPTTRFNRNWRPLVGGGHRDMWGQHTYTETGQQGGNQLAGKARMRPPRRSRLTVQRYRGQSYSATTLPVGG